MAERLTQKGNKIFCYGEFNDKYTTNKENINQYVIDTQTNPYYEQNNCCFGGKAIDKLAQLEDIMEKYGIESLDILEQELKIAREIERLKNKEFDLSNSAIVDKNFYKDFTKKIEELKTDRDTWKRACELACEEIDSCDNYGCKTYTIPLKEMPQYFYQQAKKEGNDE